ncbi:MAG: tetratricopeptide repeat protein [Pseudomonadota bacterium]
MSGYTWPMRLFLFAIFSFAMLGPEARADQTDTRLDSLFEELRTGDALSADETVDRIVGIWADSQSDTVDLLYARASQSVDAGDYDVALALLDHVVGLTPNFADGYALRGVVRMSVSEEADAVADFSKALELEPRHFGVRMALAEWFLANGDKREAYDMLQKVLEWNPHNEPARRRARALRRELDSQEI